MSLLRVVIDIETDETSMQVRVQGAFLHPEAPPEELSDSGQMLRALDAARQAVLQRITLHAPSVVPASRILVPR